ncbi:hypothetical protein [Crateriforma conspicua]|uniref:Glycoside hydrolase family 5 domain-containing protein n=1 Tax=Crateriforma conspicua TaxID=2527996 RepID=A0A5C5Y8Z9_9PLAN|nr:hypothetical protein [Crateriforma conspicua]TWT71293.1 hypothetical protein Pan14r_36030 [Crateriforma conspicua]
MSCSSSLSSTTRSWATKSFGFRIAVKGITPNIFLFLSCVGFIAWSVANSVIAASPATDPLSLHPDNDRYFQFRGQPTVLVTSGEHYGLLLNKAFDYEAYFKELQRHGLNHTRVFSGIYREVPESFGITENPLAPTHEDYSCPWQRTAKSHGDGSPIFDLSKWDAGYFDRLHRMMQSASKHGIVVEFCIFCPMYRPILWDVNPMNVRNNVNNVGDCGSKQVYTGEDKELFKVQQKVAERLVEAVVPFDNVYIEVCNEPYFGGITDRWQNMMADVIAKKLRKLSARHLISVNVANKTKKVTDPHPNVSIFNFHYCHPPVVVAENAHLHGVIGENETGFRGQADLLYRTEGWDFLLAGGATYNNLDYSFTVSHPGGTLTDYQSPGGGSERLRMQLGFLKSRLMELPVPDIQPQDAKFAACRRDDILVSAIGKAANAYLVYAHVKLPGKIKDQPLGDFKQTISDSTLNLRLPNGDYRVRQWDPKTAKLLSESQLRVKDRETSLKLNDFQTDTCLSIQRQESKNSQR